jgi:nucleoside 2-deoxyribosyltransferase
MLKVYLAGMFSTIATRKAQAAELREVGIEVTSRWIDETVPHTVEIKDVEEAYLHETAIADLEDINKADIFLAFVPTAEELVAATIAASSRGGRHVEFGYALAKGKPIFVVGSKENVFHYLPLATKHFKTFRQALVEIKLFQFCEEEINVQPQ